MIKFNSIQRQRAINAGLRKKVKRLEQDVEDMNESRQTQFHRCEKCKRIHDDGYQCWHCEDSK